tara:strand:+ start:436 stop:663 length:228 start_codon:yes stop_codon:yes gene_type:complete
MNVFTFQYETSYGDSLVSVFDSIDAVITRLELMKLHDSFEECESIKIDCQEVVDNDEMTQRLERIKKHYEEHPRK